VWSASYHRAAAVTVKQKPPKDRRYLSPYLPWDGLYSLFSDSFAPPVP